MSISPLKSSILKHRAVLLAVIHFPTWHTFPTSPVNVYKNLHCLCLSDQVNYFVSGRSFVAQPNFLSSIILSKLSSLVCFSNFPLFSTMSISIPQYQSIQYYFHHMFFKTDILPFLGAQSAFSIQETPYLKFYLSIFLAHPLKKTALTKRFSHSSLSLQQPCSVQSVENNVIMVVRG